MPVWHARTKAHVAAGRLAVLGITQEQHPARCRLFAQWHGIDWPILWDAFNLTEATAVPRFTLVDAHGVVRVARARPADLDAFLATDWEASPRAPATAPENARLVAPGVAPDADEVATYEALLYEGPDAHDAAVRLLSRQQLGVADGTRRFRLGVAHRLRNDGPAAHADDFSRALGLWTAALRQRPDQYIWRRRIQQYGPRPDKPYPFYDWVERARAEITERGETPVVLPVPLTETERNAWREAAVDETEPDPQARVPRAEGKPVASVEAAVAWSTSPNDPRTGRVHLRVVLLDPERASFASGQAVEGWIHSARGISWQASPRRLVGRVAVGDSDDDAVTGPVALELEIKASTEAGKPGKPEPVDLEGYLLLPLCFAADGRCVVVRQAFEVHFLPPGR